MGRADRDDTRQTTDFDSPTLRIGGAFSEGDDAVPRAPLGRRHGPRLWLPLAIFVMLLAAAAAVGRFVVPNTAAPQSAPSQVSSARGAGGPTSAATPTLPTLPTPPPRPADALAGWATAINGATDIPVVAAEAYGYAQLLAQQTTPNCHLGWTTLAGIGKIESDHGRAGGAVLGANGRSTPPINGPALDGKDGRALVADTDGGAYDGDASFDRMMGPLHLLPSIWATYRTDADADGVFDPYDIDDASAALARYLCSGTEDLNTLAGWRTAVARYRTGSPYERTVFEAADSYGQRTRSIG